MKMRPEIEKQNDNILEILKHKRVLLEEILHNKDIDTNSSLYKETREKWEFSVKLSQVFH